MARETNREQTSQRLRETREALGYDNASEYARLAGIGPKAYLNYENGFRPGLREAIKLCETYFLSLDWIYFGEPTALLSMPSAIADKIRGHKPSGGKAAPKRGRPFRRAS